MVKGLKPDGFTSMRNLGGPALGMSLTLRIKAGVLGSRCSLRTTRMVGSDANALCLCEEVVLSPCRSLETAQGNKYDAFADVWRWMADALHDAEFAIAS